MLLCTQKDRHCLSARTLHTRSDMSRSAYSQSLCGAASQGCSWCEAREGICQMDMFYRICNIIHLVTQATLVYLLCNQHAPARSKPMGKGNVLHCSELPQHRSCMFPEIDLTKQLLFEADHLSRGDHSLQFWTGPLAQHWHRNWGQNKVSCMQIEAQPALAAGTQRGRVARQALAEITRAQLPPQLQPAVPAASRVQSWVHDAIQGDTASEAGINCACSEFTMRGHHGGSSPAQPGHWTVGI